MPFRLDLPEINALTAVVDWLEDRRMTLLDLRVLVAIERDGPLNAWDIAEIVQRPVPAVTTSTARLQRRGMLARSDDHVDIRLCTLTLDERGRSLLEAVASLLGMTPGERAALSRRGGGRTRAKSLAAAA
jgi:DNA-binding MarR family transcriptional regulator